MNKNIFLSHIRSVIILIILLSLTNFTACGKPDLSRSEAVKQIEKSDRISHLSRNIPFSPGAIQRGVSQGIWTFKRESSGFASWDHVIMGAKAQKAISSISMAEALFGKIAVGMVPREAAVIRVEVTGIASVPGTENLKEVQFAWHYDKLPSFIKRFAVQGGSGVSHFRLFDDGWRLEDVKVETSKVPAMLSSQEAEEAKADEKATLEIRTREIEAKKASAEKLDKRIQESKKPTKVIETLSFQFSKLGGKFGKQEINLTDVDFEFYNHYDKKRKVWFGDIQGFGDSIGFPDIHMRFRNPAMVGVGVEDAVIPFRTVEDAIRFQTVIRAAIASWHSKFSDIPRK